VLLLAFALRVWRLDAQSIWYDEGLSLFLARQAPAQTVALSAATDHPPLHTLLLNGWLRVAGDSDFAARYLSVFFGVLAVVLTYAVGARIDRRAGLIGAGLLALSPLAVYYSQETRGYALLLALVLTATWASLRLLTGDRRRPRWWLYVAAMSAALYTHYFAAFVWAAINTAWIINAAGTALFQRTGAKRTPVDSQPGASAWFVVSWLIAQAAIVVLFAPWLPNALAQAGSNATYFPGRVTWETVVGETWRAFVAGEWGDASVVGGVWLALGVLGIVSLLRPRNAEAQSDSVVPSRAGVWAAIWLVLWLIVPLIAMSALAWLKPKFAPRYLLPSLPALMLLAALGVAALIDLGKGRYGRAGSIGLAVSLLLPLSHIAALMPLYTDDTLARPDVRSVARYITAHEAPADAIILIGGHQAPAFEHYYRGAAALYPLPPDLLPAAQSPLDGRALDVLGRIAAQHPRVWLVLWQNEISDPTGVVSGALLREAVRLPVGENFHRMAVLLFDVRDAQFEAAPQIATDFTFIEALRLVGYNVNLRRIPVDMPLELALYLKTDGLTSRNLSWFVHVLAADGRIVAQADPLAGADSYPTSLWRPGTLMINRVSIMLPPATPPGRYRISVGLYDRSGRVKLSDTITDHIELFELEVIP